MFCPNCGTKNEDDAMFCAGCGMNFAQIKETQNEQPVQENVQPAQQNVQPAQENVQPAQENVQPQAQPKPVKEKKPRKPVSKKLIGLIAAGAAVIAAVIIFVAVGFSVSSCDKAAVKYVEALYSGDFGTVYNNIDVPEGEFMSKDMFIFACQNRPVYKSVSAEVHELTELEKKLQEIEDQWNMSSGNEESSDQKKVNVDFSYYETDEEISSSSTPGKSSTDVSMVKADGKVMLFFPKWRVDNKQFIAKDFTISVPKGYKLYLDGVEVAQKYLDNTEESDSYDTYRIDVIFKGQHKMRMTSEIYEDYEDTFSISYDEQTARYSQTGVKKEVLEQLGNKAIEDVDTLYQKVIAETSFEEIGLDFSEDEDRRASLKKTWNSFTESQVKRSRGNLKKIEFSKTKASASRYSSTLVQVNVSFSYKATLDEGSDAKDVSADNRSVTLYYRYENGKWCIYSMSLRIIR